jgi:hypothetical protein
MFSTISVLSILASLSSVSVPYTIHTNNIVNYEARHWMSAQVASELKYQFVSCMPRERHFTVVSTRAHDRITDRPARTRTLEGSF